MARYFFHLRNHEEQLLDPQGQNIDNAAGVAPAAMREARALLAHDVLSGRINLDQRIDVENEAGKVVHTLYFNDAVVILGGT